MVFIPVPDCAQAILVYGNVTNTWTNTLWFEKAGFDETDQGLLAQYLHNWAAANIMPELSSTFSIQTVKVYDERTSLGPVEFSGLAPVGGSQPANAAPISTALVVSIYTDQRGRSGRGRNYITGFCEDDVSSTSVNTALRVTNIQQAYTTLINEVQTSVGWFWQVVSKYGDGEIRTPALSLNVDHVAVRTALLGSQRRRIDRET
jgi:hypothetical protein